MNNRVPTKFEVEQSKLKGIYNFCVMGVQWGNPGSGWGYTFFESPVKITRAGLRFIPPVNAQEMTVKDWTGLLDIKDEHKFTLPLDKVMQAKRAEAIEKYCAACPIVYISVNGEVKEFYVDPVKLSVKELYER